MDCRLEPIIREPHQEVADVDDKCVLHGRYLDPLAVFGEDLQPADVVLPEQGKALQVGVSSQADINGCLLRLSILGVVVDNTVTVKC